MICLFDFEIFCNFSDRLYCTSDSGSYFLIVRSDRYRLYEVSVNGDHKTCMISTETHVSIKHKLISMIKYFRFGFSIVSTHFSYMHARNVHVHACVPA